ncbi:MAG: FG-GAP repeat protein [Leptospiraceae bacterium]|nr:FG-GAP repeat protein [Leptospiraceae bacterium]MBP9164657.1 FG-GAP repeat protein [Leptospiraceae bacterium]
MKSLRAKLSMLLTLFEIGSLSRGNTFFVFTRAKAKANDNFGTSVSISSDTITVGAIGDITPRSFFVV